jgi:putrescine transport system substrate-binding protein
MTQRKSPRWAWVSILLAALAPAAPTQTAAPATAAEPPVVHVYNWSDYIPPQTIANFERETGIRVRYDTFESNEVLHAKLVVGRTGYDVVVPSANWAGLQITAGLYRPLDKALLPNLRHLDPALVRTLEAVDPGNKHLVNWAWGFITLGINTDKVARAIAPLPMPANAWALLFDPAYASKLKSCGLSVLASATDNFPPALHYLGLPAFSRDPKHYEQAAQLMRKLRPSVTLFSSDGYINDLASGSLCLALGYSGDISRAAKRARAAGNGQRIQALIPSTGGILFYDNMAIPADAPHARNAHAFINYMLRPEVAASVTELLDYPTMNAAATPLLSAAARGNPAVTPSDVQKRSMVPGGTVAPELRRLMTRLYTQFKSGQ